MSAKSETRSYPRKVLRSRARIALPGKPTIHAQTVDISLGGICVMVTEQLPVGQSCNVGFEAPLNGSMVRVFASAKVIYSILRGTDGFRTGLQFVQLDAANNKLLAEIMI
ncbi:MAG TPA: PilZ domain-containing protein [Noviherbaspirillum sp.]|uniref:PilZ domain-containing protein n=1 Tax=Noviherbaspirillum sp. TaxID=1926288 RepID=UPI002D75BA1F|nr:PilZ domain-containing protein [Noviherbaspirillum sp.]HYD94344.1 PilZ domain-containing protein [Noviherbaspirillum sp.]